MTLQTRRKIWALALALAVVGWSARDVQASAITYGTTGYVDIPAGGDPTAVTFQGATGTVDGTQSASLNLGEFGVSAAAQSGPVVNYTGDMAHIFVYSGTNQSELITGTINGETGAGATTPLTLTITSVMPFGGALPFNLNVATGVPMTLGTTATIFSAAASPIPEPSSVAVFGLALSGLALWRRRAGR